VDVVDTLDMVVGSDRTVLRFDIVTVVKMKSHLSGMPKCRIMMHIKHGVYVPSGENGVPVYRAGGGQGPAIRATAPPTKPSTTSNNNDAPSDPPAAPEEREYEDEAAPSAAAPGPPAAAAAITSNTGASAPASAAPPALFEMPLNNNHITDVNFHQCVDLEAYEVEDPPGAVSFIPPDGEFELMTFRAHWAAVKEPLVQVVTVVQSAP